jgi:hypothetical protein
MPANSDSAKATSSTNKRKFVDSSDDESQQAPPVCTDSFFLNLITDLVPEAS